MANKKPLTLGDIPEQKIELKDLTEEQKELLKIQMMEEDYASWAAELEKKMRQGDIYTLEKELEKIDLKRRECALIMAEAIKDIQMVQLPGMERKRPMDTKKHWNDEQVKAQSRYDVLTKEFETLMDTPIRVTLRMDHEVTDILTPVAVNGIGYSVYWTDDENEIVQVLPYKAVKVLKESYKVKYRTVKDKQGNIKPKMVKLPPQLTLSIATREDVQKAKEYTRKLQLDRGGAVYNEGSI